MKGTIFILSLLVLLVGLFFYHGELFKKSYIVHTEGVVLITGASTGIGRDAAVIFAKNGYQVIAGVRKNSDAESIAKDHKNIIPIILDVSKEKDIINAKNFVKDYLKKENKQLVGLINNAGITYTSPLEFTPMEDVRNVMEINFFGVISLTQSLLPFIRQSQGRIINIGSLMGEVTLPFSGAYCSTKASLRVITDAFRRELNPWKIYVGIVEPSYVTTSMGDRGESASLEIFSKIPEESKHYYEKQFSKENIAKRKKEKLLLSERSEDVSNVIYNVFINPRPNARYLLGYGSYQVQFLSHFSDALIDFIAEKDYWSKKHQQQ
jgi:short-subunit dehydrogenase